ncbi:MULTISPECIES: hypothetical protein [unclassified Pseudomonas]|uniref:hypothetical protein n=1 Tax=unclassified Pseudomonas TaxID=196821 RepID=UPI0039B76E63
MPSVEPHRPISGPSGWCLACPGVALPATAGVSGLRQRAVALEWASRFKART